MPPRRGCCQLHKTYGLEVVAIPTHRPIARIDHEDVVYRTEKEKWTAIAEEIEHVHATGQPILVATASVENSARLSRGLSRRGVAHEVLNARKHASEARIIAGAGEKGAVTVATNMAGRGADIQGGGLLLFERFLVLVEEQVARQILRLHTESRVGSPALELRPDRRTRPTLSRWKRQEVQALPWPAGSSRVACQEEVN